MSEHKKTHYSKAWARFCGRCLRWLGWTPLGGPPPEPRCIMLGVPHTSNMDFIISYLFFSSFGEVGRVMIKKELFFPPLGWLLRAAGCIPVDRKSPGGLVRSIISEMGKTDFFKLAIAPEGTRKPVKRWKTGALIIAKEAGIPIYAGWFDWKKKQISCGEKFPLTGDTKADLERLQEYYERLHLTARHPDKYITH